MKKRNPDSLLAAYLTFTRNERVGFFALITLLALLLVLQQAYAYFFPDPLPRFTVTELQSDAATISDSAHAFPAGATRFTFNPNTADAQTLKALGFTAQSVRALLKGRAKGWKIRKPEDLFRVYGTNPNHITSLLPFVRLAQEGQETPSGDTTQVTKRSHLPLELNTADSVQLVALYRIGPALAHRILEYRTKLGGFVSLDQLKELWGFDEDILYDLQDKIYVDASTVKPFNLNLVTKEVLSRHPYFKYKLSNAIISYREQHGTYQSAEDLKKLVLLNDSIINKIRPYISF